MVTVDASATAVDGVTLVTVTLAGDGVDRYVRLEQQLDGPVWPPRREGRPADGWDEGGYEGVVPADARIALGYATPAPPTETPVTVTAAEPVATRDRRQYDGHLTDPDDVVRQLGDPSPPREAVPLPDESGRKPVSKPDESTNEDEAGPVVEAAADTDSVAASDTDAPVRAWFERVEQRLAAVERLDEADSVPAATAALRATGGLAQARETTRAVEADRRRLLAVARRAETLAARAEAADVPIATLERLA